MKNGYKIKILQKKNSDGVSFFFKMGTYIQNSTRFAWLVPFDKLRDQLGVGSWELGVGTDN